MLILASIYRPLDDRLFHCAALAQSKESFADPYHWDRWDRLSVDAIVQYWSQNSRCTTYAAAAHFRRYRYRI